MTPEQIAAFLEETAARIRSGAVCVPEFELKREYQSICAIGSDWAEHRPTGNFTLRLEVFRGGGAE